MKVTIDIDCTPLEARQFLGLPDVQPMQQAIMAEIERKMKDEMANFSADKMLSNWLSLAPQNADWLKSVFGSFAGIAGGGKSGKPVDKP